MEPSVRIEVRGLSLRTHHGVTAEEQRAGQRLVLDVTLELAGCEATRTDRLEDTVDYATVVDLVASLATERSYRTLERLAAVIAERLVERFGCRRATVRATKPEPPLSATLDGVGVEVERHADPVRGERIGYLGLGSNLGDRREALRAAARELDALPEIEVLAASSVYETEPVGEAVGQPSFLNACLRVCTSLAPIALLDRCKAVEGTLGREPGGRRHGPRPIDVDLLLLGNERLQDERLTLPHPEVTNRRFVLAPLVELEPDLELPDGRSLAACLRELGPGQAVERLGSFDWSPSPPRNHPT